MHHFLPSELNLVSAIFKSKRKKERKDLVSKGFKESMSNMSFLKFQYGVSRKPLSPRKNSPHMNNFKSRSKRSSSNSGWSFMQSKTEELRWVFDKFDRGTLGLSLSPPPIFKFLLKRELIQQRIPV